jgi:NADH-quinone oxidoreductase subunit C
VPEESSSTETVEPAGEEDALRQPLLDTLRHELGEAVLGSELARGDLWVRVHRDAWFRAGQVCRDQLGLTYLCFISGIDWQPNPELLGEKAWEGPEDAAAPATSESGADDDEEAAEVAAAEATGRAMADEEAEAEPPASGRLTTGVAGGDTRFQVFARLYNVTTHVGLTLKTDLDEDDPRVASWVPLWRGADWHERECWEMYGFQFTGHPALRHLYLPGEFEGHPLRKDFPLLARLVKPWPGLVDVEPIPGEADAGEAAEAAEGSGEG